MGPGEREFFVKIKKAIILNPFSRERLAVDLELTGGVPSSSEEESFNKLLNRIGKAVDQVLSKSRNSQMHLAAADADLLRYAILFKIFYLYCDDYDELIRKQVSKGEESCRVDFAQEVLQRLVDYGFNNVEALRFFALFYQMRRAFFFIQKIAGESDCVEELRKNLWNNIFTNNIELYDRFLWNRMEDFSTMLLGETGTGKGLAAAAIGRSGCIPFNDTKNCFAESFQKTFISINLSKFPEQLIESELFGHKKGAFTGAVEQHRGIFSHCSPCGAIFIDEVGEVSIPVQIKLLQVLQERQFSLVGSHKTEKFNGRVIAATNQPLRKIREEGKFRDDFYYRLCSDVIEVPPLRQRIQENPGELKIILSFIVSRILGRPSQDLVDRIGEYIIINQPENYGWPGNIRELEQCVRQILLRQYYTWQREEDTDVDQLHVSFTQGKLTAQQLLGRYCKGLYKRLGTYGAVARVTDLDRRTVTKYIKQHDDTDPAPM